MIYSDKNINDYRLKKKDIKVWKKVEKNVYFWINNFEKNCE